MDEYGIFNDIALFQSRNRGSFDFKSTKFGIQLQEIEFQSRNRGSFDFKFRIPSFYRQSYLSFQSRNRGSFDFKRTMSNDKIRIHHRFNLVIEVLLISSSSRLSTKNATSSFQSRNRGSFDFKMRKRTIPKM